jgi:hypothetical protein
MQAAPSFETHRFAMLLRMRRIENCTRQQLEFAMLGVIDDVLRKLAPPPAGSHVQSTQWPWPRKSHVSILPKAGVAVQMLDLPPTTSVRVSHIIHGMDDSCSDSWPSWHFVCA